MTPIPIIAVVALSLVVYPTVPPSRVFALAPVPDITDDPRGHTRHDRVWRHVVGHDRAPAPTSARSPTVTPARIVAWLPSDAPVCIRVGICFQSCAVWSWPFALVARG